MGKVNFVAAQDVSTSVCAEKEGKQAKSSQSAQMEEFGSSRKILRRILSLVGKI